MISIIIRVKNEAATIERLLESILVQDISYKFEILLIDDCSTDNTVAVATRYPIRLIKLKPGQFSYGRALNIGGKLAKGRIIVNLSADCLPVSENWLSCLVAPLRQTDVIATYGRQIPILGVNPFEEINLQQLFPPRNVNLLRKAFSNANCSIKKEIWQKYPFNEEIASMEDLLWYEQVKSIGRVEYVVKAAVYHSHPITKLIRRYRRLKRDGMATVYLKRYYNIDVRARLKTTTSFFPFISTLVNYAIALIVYLVKKRYYKALLLFPIYQIVHYLAYFHGKKIGERLYL